MKELTINLNANEAQGEAYWRKRCDVVEAEIERIKRNHGCAREQGSTQYCSEAIDAHKEADRLRAEVEILVWNLAGISTMACRRTPILYNGEIARPALDEVAELVKDYDRLRSVNAELKENVLLLQKEYLRQNPCTDPQDDIDELQREVYRLRSVNAELTKQIEVQKKTLEIVLEEAEEWGRFVEVDNAPMQIRPYLERAISRAEQAKQESDKLKEVKK